jgi:D-arabinose 1-dehydrogenase-like Zn-dependent alcohol dehydrogenase
VLGARQYIDSKSQNPVEELMKLGGAKIILGTGPGGKAMSSILGGLAVNGKSSLARLMNQLNCLRIFSSLDIDQ